MYKFESFESAEAEGTNVEREEDKELTERDPFLQKLWKKYNFVGEAPFKGSPVEARLYDACKRYDSYTLNLRNSESVGSVNPKDDGENYFVKRTKESVLKPSGTAQRELHNMIAMMTKGLQRSGMEYGSAEQVTFFACEYVYGCSMQEAVELKKRDALVERGI